jgi:hypothetical protein
MSETVSNPIARNGIEKVLQIDLEEESVGKMSMQGSYVAAWLVMKEVRREIVMIEEP